MIRATVVACVALLCLAGCGNVEHGTTVTSSSALAPSAVPTMVESPSPTAPPLPTATPMPTATPFPTATPLPMPTATPTLTRIPIQTPRPIPTPAPTPSATSAVAPSPAASPTVSDSVTPVSTYKVQAEFATDVTKDYQPFDPKTVFSSTDKWIYLVYTVANVPTNATFEVGWVAVDVPEYAHNYEFLRDHCDCHYDFSADRTGFFALGSPTGGYFAGSYRAYLYLNGALIGIYPFEIK